MKEKKNTYSYRDSGNVQHNIELDKNSFVLTNGNKTIKDEKLKTKPTTFFKDALKRFTKNKSSVVGAIILGTLLILSFVLPVAITNDTSTTHPEAQFLEPKLFPAGSGFWDGTRKIDSAVCSNVPVTEESNAESDYKNTVGYLYPNGYSYRAVMNLTEPKENYVNYADEFVSGGSLRITNQTGYNEEAADYEHANYYSSNINFDSSLTYTLDITLSTFDDGDKQYYTDGEYAVAIQYEDVEEIDGEYVTIKKVDFYTEYKKVEPVDGKETMSLNLNQIASEKGYDLAKYSNGGSLTLFVKSDQNGTASLLVSSLNLKASDEESVSGNQCKVISFDEGNELMLRSQKLDNGEINPGFWYNSNLTVALYKGIAKTCSFTLDTYENKLGVRTINVGLSKMAEYAGYTQDETTGIVWQNTNSEVYKKRSIDMDLNYENLYEGNEDYIISTFKLIEGKKSPIIKIHSMVIKEEGAVGVVVNFVCDVYYYRYMGYGDNMPLFLFGTDKSGKDMLKITFSGLRTSLLLGIFTFVTCFTFGLVLGAIEGYYGGWVDIIIQRFTEILSGIPWIVVMTLVILALGSNFWTFALALCLTGWIGTSNLTRTQFYRFKGREYILASRTLGSSDMRLIFKHILPNSMGTIITSSVLMIPSVIFSEATISYLGLGLKNIDSLGVILSDNQPNLKIYPYSLILPAVVIALIMISFNLFGNGLRDAFNPTLKGED